MWTRDINFVSGLQLLENNTVHMSYGAFDVDARMLSMSLKDLEKHFDDDYDCSRAKVMKSGPGRGKPSRTAAAGGADDEAAA
jgi:hypothetical protein